MSDIASRILYEDNHVIVINKRAGELSQADKTGDASVIDILREYRKKAEDKPGEAFVGLVHRLDRPTSGILVCAKTSKALSRLNASFQSRDVEKKYWLIADAPPPQESGMLIHWLDRNEKSNKSTAYTEAGKDRQEAKLSYKLLSATDRYWLWEVSIYTGRHHQIRAQLAAIGVHIKGDLKYGAKRSDPDGGISLHACRLSIPHPVKDQILPLFADPVQVRPEKMWTLFPRGLEIDAKE